METQEWVRGATIGRGSFGTVSLAASKSSAKVRPVPFAVKSAIFNLSSSLQNEKRILSQLNCPQIVRYFGDDFTIENGERFYNLFLEYLPGGSLADLVRDSGGNLPESDIRQYTRSILEGLCFIHGKGFVHCDIKLQNILLGSSGVKIADFGLAKLAGEQSDGEFLRGTPLYMSPESVLGKEHEASSDIWALGCVVAEMFSGKPVWKSPGNDLRALVFRIALGDELPEIPIKFSEEGRDFLSKCFIRDPKKRWNAQQLLDHPFVCLDRLDGVLPDIRISPRSALDFPQWERSSTSLASVSVASCSNYEELCGKKFSPADRIRQLATEQRPDWIYNTSSQWIVARQVKSPVLEMQKIPLKLERTQAIVSSCSATGSSNSQPLSDMIMGNSD